MLKIILLSVLAVAMIGVMVPSAFAEIQELKELFKQTDLICGKAQTLEDGIYVLRSDVNTKKYELEQARQVAENDEVLKQFEEAYESALSAYNDRKNEIELLKIQCVELEKLADQTSAEFLANLDTEKAEKIINEFPDLESYLWEEPFGTHDKINFWLPQIQDEWEKSHSVGLAYDELNFQRSELKKQIEIAIACSAEAQLEIINLKPYDFGTWKGYGTDEMIKKLAKVSSTCQTVAQRVLFHHEFPVNAEWTHTQLGFGFPSFEHPDPTRIIPSLIFYEMLDIKEENENYDHISKQKIIWKLRSGDLGSQLGIDNIDEQFFQENSGKVKVAFTLAPWDTYSDESIMLGTYQKLIKPEPVIEEPEPVIIPEPVIEEPEPVIIAEPEPIPTPTQESSGGGGCLIATAAFGSEMAPQVQFLREIRDNTVMSTQSGTTFMTGFNQFYYSFSPQIADYERENPIFKEAVKVTLTPLLTSLTLLNYVEIDSEEEMLGYGIGIILLNVGMYFVVPAVLIIALKNRLKN